MSNQNAWGMDNSQQKRALLLLREITPFLCPHFILFIFLINLLFLFFTFYLFIYLFLAVLGLRYCEWGFSTCGEWWLLFRCGARASHCAGFSCCRAQALGARASVVVAYGLISCGSQASLLRSMSDLPRLGIKPVSPALAGGF